MKYGRVYFGLGMLMSILTGSVAITKDMSYVTFMTGIFMTGIAAMVFFLVSGTQEW